MDERLWIPALLLVVWAGWLDLRSRRIPNWLTLPALLLGLGVNTVILGWDGTKVALGGAGLALGLLLPFVLLRGLGAGDWKLMGALGAWLGPIQTLFVLLATILIAGIIASWLITWHRRWKVTLGNLRELVLGCFVGLRPHKVITLDNPGLLTVPFGTAAAVATSLCYLSSRI
ncbi:MAG: prepilin peptidase [Acidobacteria bacterium]|nr:prepilin peptidase [Acidobacteriota bacterium]